MSAYPIKYQQQFALGRKTLSQCNSQQLTYLNHQKNHIQNDKDFQIGNNSSYYSGDIQIQQVTEQFVFQNTQSAINNKQKSQIFNQSHLVYGSKPIFFQDSVSVDCINNIKKYSFNEKGYQLNKQQYFDGYKTSQQYNNNSSHLIQQTSINTANNKQQDDGFNLKSQILNIPNAAQRMKMIFPSEKYLYSQNTLIKIKQVKEKLIQAKQQHNQFFVWIQNQKSSFWKYFKQSIEIIIERISIRHIQTINQQKNSNTFHKNISNSSQNNKSTSKSLQIQKNHIRQQVENIYKHKIQSLQRELKQYKQKYLKDVIASSENLNYSRQNYQSLNDQINLLKIKLQQKNYQISKLQSQNQSLNQHIFDIQQQIQGIDIIVEQKVRSKVKQLQQQNHKINKNHKITPLKPIIQKQLNRQSSGSSYNLKTQQIALQKLKQQNESLKQKIYKLQKNNNNSQQQQLIQLQKILNFRELQVKKNQQQLNKEWQQIQRIQDDLFKNQQNHKINQQNLIKQIQSIRQKQNQFIRWQAQLYQKQLSINQKQKHLNKQRQQLNQKQQQLRQKQFKQSSNNYYNNNTNMNNKQLNKTNSKPQLVKRPFINNNQEEQNNIDQNYKMSFNPNHYKKQITNNPIINQKYQQNYQRNYQNIKNQRNQRNYQNIKNQRNYQNIKNQKNYQIYNRRRNHQSIQSKQYSSISMNRNNYNVNHRQNQNNIALKRQNLRKNRQQSRQMTNISNSKYSARVSQPVSHQFVLPPSIKGRSPSRSKSRSNQKSYTLHQKSNSFNNRTNKNGSELYHKQNSNSNLNGLGSKLQKLREQIKKQISSIK